MSTQVKKRIFGLDLLRASAITMVILVHSYTLFPSKVSDSIPLPDGVDLFFVLSGYLIGSILLRTMEKHKNIDFLITLQFLIRRWFRTLPNYFLFLLINILLVYYSLIPGQVNKFIVTYFVFFQNFHKPYDFIFWESWSLSVEEWFYLLFPCFLSFIFMFKRTTTVKIRKRYFLFGILIMLIFPLVYRIIQSSASLDTDLYFRKIVLMRFDTIGFGLMAAYFHYYFSSFWEKTNNLTFILGFIIVSTLVIFDHQSVFFNQTFEFTMTGFGIALLIPKLSTLKDGGIFSKPITYLSKISYSLYLVHLPVLHILCSTKLMINPVVFYLLFWAIIIIISDLIFRFYETPLMNLREKINITALKSY